MNRSLTRLIGAICIYRAPGSVAFLSCGSVLQPILPKSQCWRVDQQNSKFVLQIRRPYYWRIELPVSSAEQSRTARQFRDTLESILLLEKTRCPFRRPFTVELPHTPDVKQKPWTPPRRQRVFHNDRQSATSFSASDTALSYPPSAGEYQHCPKLRSSEQATTQAPQTSTQLTQQTSLTNPTNASNEASSSADSGAMPTEPEEIWHDLADGSATEIVEAVVPELAVQTHSLHENETARLWPAYQMHKSNMGDCLVKKRCGSPSSPVDFVTETPLMLHQEAATIAVPTAPELNMPRTSDANPNYNFNGTHEGRGNQEDLHKPKLRYFRGYRGGRSSTSPPPKLSLPTSRFSGLVAPRPITHDTKATGTLPGEESPELFYSAPSSLNSDVEHTGVSRITAQQVHPTLEARESEDDSTAAHPSYICYQRLRSGSGIETATDVNITGDLGLKHTTEITTTDIEADGLTRRMPTRRSGPFSDPARIFDPMKGTEELQDQGTLRNPLKGRLDTLGGLPMAIVSKTYNLVIGPPRHLVALMLRIAARICAGEWKGEDIGFAASGQAIPVRWDYSTSDNGNWSNEDCFEGAIEEDQS